MKSYQEFFAELKRRKVFKVAAVYGAVAFALIQLADPLAEALRLPETFLPFVVAILLLGFPVAIVLAWAFEVTPEGVQKTEAASREEIAELVAQPASKRWPAGILALVGTAALLGAVWWTGLSMGRADNATGGSQNGVAGADSLRLALGTEEEDDRPSIAVLPFEDMSPEGDQEYFSDGMTEEIMNTLADVRELRVAGRTSAFAYKGEAKDLRQIGDALGVSYLVEGSVRKSGDQLRITAQLIDAEDGSHLWSDSYNREMMDVFAIQTEIATSIAEALRIPLGLDGDDRLVTPTADLEAYDLYLAGRNAMRARGARVGEAIRLFEAAVARDSSWAPAWAGLAEATEISVWYPSSQPDGETPAEYIPAALERAERAARRALTLDPDNASALVALGSLHRDRAEWEQSEAAYLRALALDPDNAEAHQQYAELLLNLGRAAEAVRAADRAARLDPAPIRFGMLSTALDQDGRLDESIEASERAGALDFTRRTGRLLARRYMRADRWDDAIDLLDEWNRMNPNEDPFVGSRAEIAAAVNGLRQGTLARPVERFIAPSVQWSMLGHPDSVVAELLAGAEDLPFGRTLEMRRRGFESLYEDPRIVAFFEERGLPGVQFQRTPVSERTRPLALRGATE